MAEISFSVIPQRCFAFADFQLPGGKDIETHLAGVSIRHVEDIPKVLWGSKVSPSTISEWNKKTYATCWLIPFIPEPANKYAPLYPAACAVRHKGSMSFSVRLLRISTDSLMRCFSLL